MDVLGRWLPLGFAYLAGAARRAGLEARIYDARAKGHGYAEIEQQLRTSDPQYVASTAITSSINDAVKTLELAKRCHPRAVTILGGLHPTYCYEEVLSTTAAVDYIVCGEGEDTLRELLVTLEQGGDPARVPGLAFRRDDRIVTTPVRGLMDSIDDLPAVWDLLEWPDYTYFVIPGSRLGAVETSRTGVPEASSGMHDASRRYRNPHGVVNEIVHLHETYGVTVVLITDEFPTRCRERWEQILDLIIERNLPVHLLMQAPCADIVRDREIMRKYRQAGVVHMYVELEASATVTRDTDDDEADSGEGKQALEILHEHGIVTEASFVLGDPDETRKDIERTLERARYYDPDNAQFLAFTPWPGTDGYDEFRPFIKVHDYSRYNLIEPVIEPAHMSLLQVDVAMVDCYRRFYMGKMTDVMTMKDDVKRKYLMQAMKLIMGSPFLLKKLCMGTLGKIPAKVEELMAGLK